MSSTDRRSDAEDVVDERLGGRRVEVSSGLVEEQHRRIRQERTGDGEPLALATGETASVFADEGVEPVGKRVGPRVEAYAGECTPEVGVRSVRSGDEEIGADAGVEDVGVLAGERERRAHVLLPVVAGVVAGDRHPSSSPGRGTAAAGS